MVHAKNKVLLKHNKITHILIASMYIKPPYKDFIYKTIPAHDKPSFAINAYFQQAIEFIDEGRKHGKVLVHCMLGVSRSSTIIIAYVMATLHLSYDDAFKYVKVKHFQASPNIGFVGQLKAFALALKKKRENIIKS